jgi:hypothetical protein
VGVFVDGQTHTLIFKVIYREEASEERIANDIESIVTWLDPQDAIGHARFFVVHQIVLGRNHKVPITTELYPKWFYVLSHFFASS